MFDLDSAQPLTRLLHATGNICEWAGPEELVLLGYIFYKTPMGNLDLIINQVHQALLSINTVLVRSESPSSDGYGTREENKYPLATCRNLLMFWEQNCPLSSSGVRLSCFFMFTFILYYMCTCMTVCGFAHMSEGHQWRLWSWSCG